MSVSDGQLSEYSQRLFDACVVAVPEWITNRIQHVCLMSGGIIPKIVTAKVAGVAHATQAQVQIDLKALLSVAVSRSVAQI